VEDIPYGRYAVYLAAELDKAREAGRDIMGKNNEQHAEIARLKAEMSEMHPLDCYRCGKKLPALYGPAGNPNMEICGPCQGEILSEEIVIVERQKEVAIRQLQERDDAMCRANEAKRAEIDRLNADLAKARRPKGANT
jgi:hypothetical protein